MRVSVIVTFYNQQEWVDQALDSLFAQTETDFDIIITNDGSTDSTGERIGQWLARNRVDATVVSAVENIGLPAILNRASAHITGRYFMIFNGDDVLMPDKVERQADALDAAPPEVGVVFSDLVVADEFGTPTGERIPKPERVHEGSIYERYIAESFLPGSPGLMFRSELLDEVGLWNDELLADDFDFGLRLSRATQFKYVPFDCVLYRVTGSSLTTRKGELADGRAIALAAHRGQSAEIDRLIDRRIAGLASAMHEVGYNPPRTRSLLAQSALRTRRPKPIRQLLESLWRSVPIGRRHVGADSRSTWPQRRLEAFGGSMSGWLSLLVGCAIVASFIEASILLVVAAVATSLALDSDLALSSIGPFALPDTTPGQLLWIAAGLVTAFGLVEALVSVISARLHSQTGYRVRYEVLKRFAAASWPSKEWLEGPSLIQLCTTNSSKAAGAVAFMSGFLVSLANFSVLVGAAFLVNQRAALFVIVLLVLTGLATVPLSKLARSHQRTLSSTVRDYNLAVQQHSTVTREVQIFGVQEASLSDTHLLNRDQAELMFRSRAIARGTSTMFRVSAFVVVICMLAVAVSVSVGNFSSLAGVALILIRAVSHGQGIQRSWHSLMESSPWIDQLEESLDRLDSADEVVLDLDSPLNDTPMSLRLENVTFGYESGHSVLDGVDLSIEAGSCVGFVGGSGSGKSTLVELMLGLRAPWSGRVLIDDVPTEPHSSRSVPGVAYLRQEPVLIRGSIVENVRFYRPWITESAVLRSLELAQILDDVLAWPQGLETDPGTLGSRLSGGQKQRIALARALAGSPRLLVLDEPTSALDAESDRLVTDTIRKLRGQMTIILVGHRSSTLSACDRVLTVDVGRVSEILDNSDSQTESVIP